MFCYQTLPRWALFTVDHRGVVCLHAKLWMNIAVVFVSVYCLSSLTLICWLQAKLWMHITIIFIVVMRWRIQLFKNVFWPLFYCSNHNLAIHNNKCSIFLTVLGFIFAWNCKWISVWQEQQDYCSIVVCVCVFICVCNIIINFVIFLLCFLVETTTRALAVIFSWYMSRSSVRYR